MMSSSFTFQTNTAGLVPAVGLGTCTALGVTSFASLPQLCSCSFCRVIGLLKKINAEQRRVGWDGMGQGRVG